MNHGDIVRIEPGSPAHDMLKEMMGRTPERAISISLRLSGVQLKWGGGTWTTPMATDLARVDPDRREFHEHTECGHLVCERCGGHKNLEESNEHDDTTSCYCCKHCAGPSH